MLTGVGISNGLGWSPDSTRMYYVDSSRYTLDVFDFDADDGMPSGQRTLVGFAAPGIPDGLAVDDDGAIWLALWDGGAVHRYTPDGRLDAIVEMPVARPTSCCFAGSTLYITTAKSDFPEAGAGSVFACETGVTGPPAVPFRRAHWTQRK